MSYAMPYENDVTMDWCVGRSRLEWLGRVASSLASRRAAMLCVLFIFQREHRLRVSHDLTSLSSNRARVVRIPFHSNIRHRRRRRRFFFFFFLKSHLFSVRPSFLFVSVYVIQI